MFDAYSLYSEELFLKNEKEAGDFLLKKQFIGIVASLKIDV